MTKPLLKATKTHEGEIEYYLIIDGMAAALFKKSDETPDKIYLRGGIIDKSFFDVENLD